jgi:hypothetical protein
MNSIAEESNEAEIIQNQQITSHFFAPTTFTPSKRRFKICVITLSSLIISQSRAELLSSCIYNSIIKRTKGTKRINPKRIEQHPAVPADSLRERLRQGGLGWLHGEPAAFFEVYVDWGEDPSSLEDLSPRARRNPPDESGDRRVQDFGRP